MLLLAGAVWFLYVNIFIHAHVTLMQTSLCISFMKIIKGSELFAAAKSHDLLQAYKAHDAKIFGGQFQDGVSNAVDPMSLIR